MLKFISLGSSSSGNCYYLATDNTQILIDAGIAVKTLRHDLKERGVMLTKIDGIFITHELTKWDMSQLVKIESLNLIKKFG